MPLLSFPRLARPSWPRRLVCFCLCALASSGAAATLLLDLGQTGFETGTDASGRRWNNLTQNAAAGSVLGLIDTDGVFGGVTLTVVSTFNIGDYNTNGDTSSAGLPYPATATRDSLFGNVGTFGGASNVVPVLLLSGLDPDATCDLVFFASRSESDNRIARYTVQGATTRAVFLDANGPAPHTVALAGMAPAADGTVRITVEHATVAESGLPTRGAGDHATGFAYLGVLEITLSDGGTEPPVPKRPLVVLPLGSSITAGQSAQSPYNGGGYRTSLYLALAADGRFAPALVGSSTTLMANSPTATNILTTVGQLRHEGHPGYTTTQVLGNLVANDGSGGNNGGRWLSPGNGVEPDFITLNVGGNDFVRNRDDTAAIGRLETLVGELATLRPNATIIVSSIVHRPDIGAYVDLHYNPFIEDVVFRQVLAGRRVCYLDLRTIMGTGYLSSDNVHPTQAGYDVMGAAWYQSVVNGAAYWTGAVDANWRTPPTEGRGNWATDVSLLSVRPTPPDATTDVYFVDAAGEVDPGADVAIRGLNFGGGAGTPVTLAAGRTLTLGQGGITVRAGSAGPVVRSGIVVAAAQTWASAGPTLRIDGVVGGSGALVVFGAGEIRLGGVNTHTGPAVVRGGVLRVDGELSPASVVTVAGGGVLSGDGTVGGEVRCERGGVIAPANGATPAGLGVGSLRWRAGGEYRWRLADAAGEPGVGFDTLFVQGGLELEGLAAGDPVRLRLVADGDARGFRADRGFVWVIAEATDGVAGFDADAFVIETDGFSPSVAGGVFSVESDGGRLLLRFTPAFTPAGEWRRIHFGTTDNAGDASDEADPDADGLSNLAEYAMGGHPRDPASAPRPVVETQLLGGALRLQLSFHATSDPALGYAVEAADSLAGAWSTIWSATGAAIPPGERVTVVDPEPLPAGGARFLRLRMSR